MFDACGTVPDFWWIYLPSSKRGKNANLSNAEIHNTTKECLDTFMFGSTPRKPCKCISPCQETVYQAEFKPTFHTNSYVYLTIYFEDIEIMKTTELPAYDSTRFLADVGGLIGLLIGMSLLSLFEVLVCLALYAFDKLCLLVFKFM